MMSKLPPGNTMTKTFFSTGFLVTGSLIGPPSQSASKTSYKIVMAFPLVTLKTILWNLKASTASIVPTNWFILTLESKTYSKEYPAILTFPYYPSLTLSLFPTIP